MFLLRTGESLDIKIILLKCLKPLLSRYENLYTKWHWNSLGITSLKQKREERLFVDLIIILILHCRNEFLKQVLNFRFKLDHNVPRYGSTMKSSFLGTVGITFFGTWTLFKKGAMDYSVIPDW